MLKKEKEHLWMAVKGVLSAAIAALAVGLMLGHIVTLYEEILKHPVFGVISSLVILSLCFVVTFFIYAALDIAHEEYEKYKTYKVNKFTKEVLFREDE